MLKKSNMPALLGGSPAFDYELDKYLTLGTEEQNAVQEVMQTGLLSGFIGAACPEFNGGPKVQELQNNWSSYFNVKHSIAVNSATSGLYAAIGAIGIEPGDEIIVTPTSMTATVAGIVLYQAIPIFADICPDTFCIDPKEIKKKITKKTKAIIGVDIYGETAEWNEINAIAKENNIYTIEDSSQSLGGLYNELKSGTLADIGIYSLNRHKHIHCGEGGICVTNNDNLAERISLIRNHGEAVVDGMEVENISNLIGFNYRMTEIEAAIANEQLKKLDYFVDKRIQACNKIIDKFKNIDGIICPKEQSHTKNVFYYLCFKINKKKLGLSRKAFCAAINAEGIPFGEGGYLPIYLQSMYQKKIAFGTKGYPFKSPFYQKEVDYSPGLCPISEKMWFEDLFYFKIQNFLPKLSDIDKFDFAINKILNNVDEIQTYFNEKD